MAKGNRDLELLIKMMGQTQNDNDNVVVMSIKKANEQVKKLAGSWEELLRGHFTIAADPFEGLNIPGFTSGNGSDPNWRRGVAPAPPPPPPQPAAPLNVSPNAPWTKPQAPPNPLNAGASAGFTTAQSRRTNTFRAVCYLCQQTCNAGQGILDGRNQITNQWRVKCADAFDCSQRILKAKSKRSKPTAAQKSTDNLANMLGD